MVKSAADHEKEFLENIVDQTGATLDAWMKKIARETDFSKKNDILKWLKANHSLNHLQASMLSGIYLNNGKPVHSDLEGLFKAQFEGKESQKPLYDKIIETVAKKLEGYNITPRKTYIQLDDKRCFAVLKVNKSNIRLGLDLGDLEFDEIVEKTKSLGAMPRFTHMIEFKSSDDVDQRFIPYLEKSRERSS